MGGAQGLATVDTRPPDYGIPTHEQDHDLGRVQPEDGQAVVDLLSRPSGALEKDEGTSRALDSVPVVLREPAWRAQNSSLSEMLYGADGTLAQPIEWRGR